MDDVTKRARELLEAATNGPWDARFIAASPGIVRGLLAENDRLRTVIYEAARALYDNPDKASAAKLFAVCANAYAILDAATPKDE